MASITIVGAGDVTRSFAAGIRAVVTAETVSTKRRVIHDIDLCPRIDNVAVIAFQGRRPMAGTLASCQHAVVTAGASADRLSMINRARRQRFPR